MPWSVLLYGCFRARGGEYDFDVLAPEDMGVGRAIRGLGLAVPSWFAGRLGERSFFGSRDLVGKILGWDHPVAQDRNRTLEFTLAYTAGADAVLPSWSEVQALYPVFENDLRRAAALAMAAPTIQECSLASDLPRFHGPARAADAHNRWDALVAGLSRGSDTVVRVERDGAAQSTSLAGAVPSPRQHTGSQPEDRELEHLMQAKAASRGGCGIVFIFAGVAAAAALVSTSGLAARERSDRRSGAVDLMGR